MSPSSTTAVSHGFAVVLLRRNDIRY